MNTAKTIIRSILLNVFGYEPRETREETEHRMRVARLEAYNDGNAHGFKNGYKIGFAAGKHRPRFANGKFKPVKTHPGAVDRLAALRSTKAAI